jgi:hypothetical protein
MVEIELLQSILNRLDIISACILLYIAYIFFREVYKLLYNLIS